MSQDFFNPESIFGNVRVPASKSLCHRALLCAALSHGMSTISNVSLSIDVSATIDALNELGISAGYNAETQAVIVGGMTALRKSVSINCHESASLLRFIIPVAAALGIDAEFTGEGRLPRRPLDFYRDMLASGGINAVFPAEDGLYLPLSISGRLRGGTYSVPGNVTSQYITGLLLALPLLDENCHIELTSELESKPYADMTVELMRNYGVSVTENEEGYTIHAGSRYRACDYTVEGDYSQAAFFAVAAALAGRVTIEEIGERSPQGDREIADIIRCFGAGAKYENGGLTVSRAPRLRAVDIDARNIPDLVPVLAVAAAFADGETHITNAARLRIKESDRLATTASMLNAIGAEVTELDDGLIIRGHERLRGGLVNSANDHRIAMAAAVASLRCDNGVTVSDMSCINKSYPRFTDDFRFLCSEGTK